MIIKHKAAMLLLVLLSLGAHAENSIVIERESCWGDCPAYLFMLFKDGQYVFWGLGHYQGEELFRSKTSTHTFDRMQTILKTHGFWDIGALRCASRETDQATIAIFAEIDGRAHQVVHYLGCHGFEEEDELLAMEEKLEIAIAEVVKDRVTNLSLQRTREDAGR